MMTRNSTTHYNFARQVVAVVLQLLLLVLNVIFGPSTTTTAASFFSGDIQSFTPNNHHQPSSGATPIFHHRYGFRNCSYEERIPSIINTNHSSSYTFVRIPLNEELFSQFRDLPFGFGCESVEFPQAISEDDFAIYIFANNMKNSEFYAPISTSAERYDVCEKYQSLQESCADLLCGAAHQQNRLNYSLVNYCQYCRNAKGFVEFHHRLQNTDSYIETPNDGLQRGYNSCGNFSKFPSAFYCGDISKGLPLYYQSDLNFKLLKNPYFCYCAKENSYSFSCDNFWNDQHTATAKMVLTVIIMVPAFIACLFAYTLPLLKSFTRKRNLNVVNIFSMFIMGAACMTMLVGGVTAVFLPILNYTLLSSSLFMIHISILPALLVFDRIYMFLKTSENRNCIIFTSITFGALVLYALCLGACIAIEVLIFSYAYSSISHILLLVNYINFFIPLLVNTLLFILLSLRLYFTFKQKTTISFFASSYFREFVVLCLCSWCSFITCLLSNIFRIYGTSYFHYAICNLSELASITCSFSCFVVILYIVFDQERFYECYPCIVKPLKKFLQQRKAKQKQKDQVLLLGNEQAVPEFGNSSSAFDNSIETSYTNVENSLQGNVSMESSMVSR
ncbi:hypothetical protein C9374_004091 [Naegleria lovaniensis]|uniref:Uncharacterized protein n=1 Tax=Naegleria lovaniensis TaxID=51637 RepID=A0AA88KL99_NAELO|nr:uncharacterized protein C9374_004091 [Naegleria lovaniensis]KAG2383420.1 hypothetical protein C9374_004091 [Naegleria lovaniensis]